VALWRCYRGKATSLHAVAWGIGCKARTISDKGTASELGLSSSPPFSLASHSGIDALSEYDLLSYRPGNMTLQHRLLPARSRHRHRRVENAYTSAWKPQYRQINNRQKDAALHSRASPPILETCPLIRRIDLLASGRAHHHLENAAIMSQTLPRRIWRQLTHDHTPRFAISILRPLIKKR